MGTDKMGADLLADVCISNATVFSAAFLSHDLRRVRLLPSRDSVACSLQSNLPCFKFRKLRSVRLLRNFAHEKRNHRKWLQIQVGRRDPGSGNGAGMLLSNKNLK